MTVFYHYTPAENVGSLMGARPDLLSGLEPQYLFANTYQRQKASLPQAAGRYITFGFLEPIPSSWAKKTYANGDTMLQRLISIINSRSTGAIAQLEVRLDSKDEVYVGEALHFFRRAEGRCSELEAKRAYWDSLMPIEDYLKSGSYFLPEVACFSSIPRERLRCIRTQNRAGWLSTFSNRSDAAPASPSSPKPRPIYLQLVR